MDNTLSIARKSNLYQDIVLKSLCRMTRGRLELGLPGGERISIGDGQDPLKATLEIRDAAFYKRCILYGDVGFGEAYVDGYWDTDDITRVISWVLLNIDQAPGVSGNKTRSVLLNVLKWWNKLVHVKRENSELGSRRNIAEHYDLNNDFFGLFLDRTMTYSSALFPEKHDDGQDNAQDGEGVESGSLEKAQLAKYERLCRQLHLRPTDHVLEIGCGWGGNAVYMARQYGCRVTSLTISAEQYRYATGQVKAAGLEDRVTVLLQDYRKLSGQFDKIVSIEMLEAVGHRYLDLYFTICHKLLKREGILALQVITCPDSRYESLRRGVDWIQKHIFPGSLLPSVSAINGAVNRTGDLTMVDLKDMGLDYAYTLKAWYDKFNARLSQVRGLGFDDRFIRKWNYYLCYCEAAFRMRNIHVMQLVYARPNNTGR